MTFVSHWTDEGSTDGAAMVLDRTAGHVVAEQLGFTEIETVAD
ncbi:hypothetical protein ACFCYC_39030 [Streptomyces sp. NPDC056402]